MQRLTLPCKGGHMAGWNFGRASGPIDVVFLHATGFCAYTYRTLLAPLGPKRRAVALDLRGHGLTTLPAHALTLTHCTRTRATWSPRCASSPPGSPRRA